MKNLVSAPVATTYANKRVTMCVELQPEALWTIITVDADSNLAMHLVYK